MTRGPALVLAGAVVLLVAILALAVGATLADPGPGGGAAELVPASALAFARLSTDPDDPAARRLARLAPRIPGYAVAGDTAVLATSPSAVEAFLDRRGPRLASTRGFRAAVPEVPAEIESLGFFDVRQLLTLGEQTGLTAEDLRPVHAASAVIQREEDDTTAELFFEIP